MAKLISVLVVLAMIAHVIRPLGLPGLRQRRDFWKLALVALAVLLLAALLGHLLVA
jgi:hypothetical protein